VLVDWSFCGSMLAAACFFFFFCSGWLSTDGGLKGKGDSNGVHGLSWLFRMEMVTRVADT